MNDLVNLKHINEIPLPYREIFSNFVCFNLVQSQVLDDILYSDESVVLSAPTGSGKTVVFELGIVKLLMKYNSQNCQDFKIVYISPIKSLCQERLVDWARKFSPFGINCICVTGDSDNIDYHQLTNHNLIISTPEKWDSLTRKWRDNETLVRVIKLFMIDEVHLLNEDDRGSTLEVIVSRMKTVQNSMPKNKKDDCHIRFMAVSATIGNVEDIAEWMDCSKFFQFPAEMRPVQLKTIVLGYNSQNPPSPFKFDLSLNYRLQSLIIQHSEGQPTLIFCNTRKSVEMTARHLVQTLKIQISPAQSQKLLEVCKSIFDSKIQEIIRHGIGIHHAGMATEVRHTIETIFRECHLPILVATSTLAMGVNLPAHLVIIKSTKYYCNGSYQDYSATAIHQMIGRAGRPQFDTHATALILTTNDNKKNVEKQLSSNEPVESNLHKHLTEHLNAEVVLGTITGLDVAMQWLASTFLYVRARKNPKHYGLPQTCRQDQLDKKLLEMFQIDLNKLMRVGMITMDEKINVSPTLTGRLMAIYCVDFETMKMFTQLTGNEVFIQILALISKCQEFSELRLRVNDKKTLNLLNRNSKKETIRFPLNGKIKTWDMKVNCIIQAVLGNIEITDVAIQTEANIILRNGERILKCLKEYLCMRKQNCYSALLNSIILAKCLHAKLWENSPYVSKQLTGIGSTYAAQLANAGKKSFDKILECNPRDIEMIIKRKPPFGNYLMDEVRRIPKYSVNLEKHSTGLRLTVLLENLENIYKKCTLNLSSIMSLLVGNNLNQILLHERFQISYTIENPEITKDIFFESLNDLEYIEAHFISEEWVGIDRCTKVYFENHNKYTDLSESPKMVEKNPAAQQSSYIQTFLDIYMKIKKPEKHKKDEKLQNTSLKNSNNTKQIKIKHKQVHQKDCKDIQGNKKITILHDQLIKNNSKNMTANKSLTYNNPINDLENNKEDLFFSKNVSDSELVGILEDHKIITAYKNDESTNLKGENVENSPTKNHETNLVEEEIVYSNNDVQEYEEIVSSTDNVQEDGMLINRNPEESNDKTNANENNKIDINKGSTNKNDLYDNGFTQQELEEMFNSSSPILFSDLASNNNTQTETTEVAEESKENEKESDSTKNMYDSFLKTDRNYFLISQKYLTDVDSEDANVNRPLTAVKSFNKHVSLRNILNFRGKKKRKLDDTHPAEELEDQLCREERGKQSFFDTFKKPQKKKTFENDNLSDARINHPYKIIEVLEPDSQRHMTKIPDCYLDNKKSIKWRSPLVFSPGIKFSPKYNYKNSENGSQNDGYNESFDTASSSSKHSMKFQKTPRRSKIDSLTNYKPLSQSYKNKFPLTDKDCESSPDARRLNEMDNIEKFSDICSSQLLESLRMKENNKISTPRVVNQDIPERYVDYYSQLTPRQISQTSSKKDGKKNLNCSQNIENKENIDVENYEEKEIFQNKSRVDLNSSQIIYESPERDTEFTQSQASTFLSQNRPMMYGHPTNEVRTRSEEYINAKIRENYPFYPDLEVPKSSRYSAAPNSSREYLEYDTETCMNSSFRPVVRSVPKPSMHYSSYVDPLQFGYHPTYGQYVRQCCEYPTEVVRRHLPPGYGECDVGPTVAHHVPHYVASEARCAQNYQSELSQQITPRQRNLSQEEYLEKRQVIPNVSPVLARHVYTAPIEQDLNSSFVLRNQPYSVNYQNFTYPLSCAPSTSTTGHVGHYPRNHPYPYEYAQNNHTFPTIDKDYVMNKYWSSFNNQQ